MIDADSLGRVVTITNSGVNYQHLTGLTIENGNHSSGAGICCMNSNSVLSHLIIQDCISQMDGGGILLASSNVEISEVKILSCMAINKGGGIRTVLSTTMLENVSLIDCSATFGGAIYDNNSELWFSNLIMKGNEAQEFGGSIFGLSSVIDINNTFIQNNMADSLGGALYIHSSDMMIANSILSHNNASIGGGIYCNGSDLNIYNTTLYSNSDVGIYGANQSEINLIDDILWHNNPQQIELDASSIIVAYSDIEGGFSGTGNINENPLFIDSNNNNFHFFEDSPCINTGTPDTTGLHLPGFDLDGNPRIYDNRIDMGAYEWQGVAVDDTTQYYQETILHHNFPNPFSSSTNISFSLPHPEKVKIQIYNLKGQLVETLLDEQKPAGNHTMEWNAEQMSSGIYFIKLITEDKHIIQKVVVIK